MARPDSAADDAPDGGRELIPTAMIAAVATAAPALSGAIGVVLAIVGGLEHDVADTSDTAANAAIVMLVLGVLFWLTWCWWCTVAAANAQRVTPLATSPWLPPAVYLGGPAIAVIGWSGSGDVARYGPGLGIAVAVLGHLAVILSLRSTAQRMRGDHEWFGRLIWVPFLVSVAGCAASWWLSSGLSDDELTRVRLGAGALVAFTQAGLVAATTGSFDRLCRSRIAERGRRGVAPSAEVVLASMFRADR